MAGIEGRGTRLIRCLAPSEPVPEHVRVVPSNAGRATPHQVDLSLRAGDVPIRMTIDFEAPVSEWHVAVLGSRRIAVADVFRDVLVVVGNDGEHRAREILRTTWSGLRTHLSGVAASGNGFDGLYVADGSSAFPIQGLPGISTNSIGVTDGAVGASKYVLLPFHPELSPVTELPFSARTVTGCSRPITAFSRPAASCFP